MTNTNREAWVNALVESQDPDASVKVELLDEYGFKPLHSLEVNADARYVLVAFKDSPRITHVFKYPEDEYIMWEIENELHRAMHELTEENEVEILQSIFTLWLMNGRLSYFAQFTDANIDASETLEVSLEKETGAIEEESYVAEFGLPPLPSSPVLEVAQDTETTD